METVMRRVIVFALLGLLSSCRKYPPTWEQSRKDCVSVDGCTPQEMRIMESDSGKLFEDMKRRSDIETETCMEYTPKGWKTCGK